MKACEHENEPKKKRGRNQIRPTMGRNRTPQTAERGRGETMNEEQTNATNYLTTQKAEENQKIENLMTGVSPAILI
jgi:hypothetical protein